MKIWLTDQLYLGCYYYFKQKNYSLQKYLNLVSSFVLIFALTFALPRQI